MEIERLHKMLTDAGIEHDWIDRTEQFLPRGHKLPRVDGKPLKFGWQIVVYDDNGNRLISAIEGYGSYGFGGFDHGVLGTDEKDGDLIEIMGCLTPEEGGRSSVMGYLTAEQVLDRIILAKGIKS